MQSVILDLETTSSDIQFARIVQIATKVLDEKGFVISEKSALVNPEVPILPSATDVHGIRDRDVENKPAFKAYAKALKETLENKIIIGFNQIKFDIPVLLNEFERAGIDIELSGQFIDAYKIEQKLYPKTLSALYKKYYEEDAEDQHDAMGDVNACFKVLLAQKQELRDRYGDDSVEHLIELSGMQDVVDYYGKLKRNDAGDLIINFGKKCFGKKVKDEPEYADWILTSPTFSAQVKKLVRSEIAKTVSQTFKKSSGDTIFDFTKYNGMDISNSKPF